MKIAYEAGDQCPICSERLLENVYGEDEVVYLECPANSKHFNKCLGYSDDMDDVDEDYDDEN